MKKNTKGCLWMGLPLLALPIVLGLWAMASFFFSSVLATQTDPTANAQLTLRIVNWVLGVFGIASILMVPVGIVLGIINFLKTDSST